MNKRKINNREFNGLVNEICRQVTISNWRPDYIVGLGRGGLLPAVMISHYLNVPMQSLDISLRDGGSCVSNCGMSEDAYEGKNILVVDDINDQGSTFNWLMTDWQESCLPGETQWQHVWNSNVRFAVVFDNLASKCEVKMDFCGEEINKAESDVWLIFPYEEWWK